MPDQRRDQVDFTSGGDDDECGCEDVNLGSEWEQAELTELAEFADLGNQQHRGSSCSSAARMARA